MDHTGLISVVDDDESVRDSLGLLLSSAGYTTQSFSNAQNFRHANKVTDWDCLLLDVRLPDADGLDLLAQLVASGFNTPVIIMTGHGDIPMAVKAMKLGAADFIEKPFEPDRLLEMVRKAIHASRPGNRPNQIEARKAQTILARLTPRETDVMRRLVAGQPNKIIAHELGLSPRTIEVHRARVMEKTGSKSLSQLVRIAITAGISPDSGS